MDTQPTKPPEQAQPDGESEEELVVELSEEDAKAFGDSVEPAQEPPSEKPTTDWKSRFRGEQKANEYLRKENQILRNLATSIEELTRQQQLHGEKLELALDHLSLRDQEQISPQSLLAQKRQEIAAKALKSRQEVSPQEVEAFAILRHELKKANLTLADPAVTQYIQSTYRSPSEALDSLDSIVEHFQKKEEKVSQDPLAAKIAELEKKLAELTTQKTKEQQALEAVETEVGGGKATKPLSPEDIEKMSVAEWQKVRDKVLKDTGLA